MTLRIDVGAFLWVNGTPFCSWRDVFTFFAVEDYARVIVRQLPFDRKTLRVLWPELWGEG